MIFAVREGDAPFVGKKGVNESTDDALSLRSSEDTEAYDGVKLYKESESSSSLVEEDTRYGLEARPGLRCLYTGAPE